MLNLNLKVRLARRLRKRTIRVQPLFFVPTYYRFERVCLVLGLDPDDVISGTVSLQAARVRDPHQEGPVLLELILENHEAIDLSRFTQEAAEVFLAEVLAHFFFLWVGRELKQIRWPGSTGSVQRPTPTVADLIRARHWPEASPGSGPASGIF
jgi:hypothetical protein